MSSAKDFPITQKYGWDPDYPLNRGINPATGREEGFHRGVDYGCPVGTPIVVNGVTIGLSGQTGDTFGPHVHVGKWLQGASVNPGLGGWSFKSAEVTQVGEDSRDGKYVRLQADGYSWVYLHMSDNSKVKVGQTLKQETNMATKLNDTLTDKVVLVMRGKHAPRALMDERRGKSLDDLVFDFRPEMDAMRKAHAAEVAKLKQRIAELESQ